MKKKLTFNYYYAYWDNAEKEKYAVKDFCYENRFTFNAIDCETKDGVNESIKNSVKLLPQVVVYDGKKEIFRVKGKNILKNCAKNYTSMATDYNRYLVYATYVIIYANDTACNSALELETFIKDEDKETKKIYGALKKRALDYIRYFNNLVGELSWATSEYFGSMDDQLNGFIDDMYDELERTLIESGAEKPKLYAKLEQVRLLCHIAVEIHNSLMKECSKHNIATYSLKTYRLGELKRVSDNLSEWCDRHFKSSKPCDMSANKVLIGIMRNINTNLMSYENFIKSYELSCNVNHG